MSSVQGTLLDPFLWIESDTLEPDRLTAHLRSTSVWEVGPGEIPPSSDRLSN